MAETENVDAVLGTYVRPLDPRLDFYSEKFDPLLALKTKNLKIPVPSAKCHDNLARYESAHDASKQKSAVESRLRKQQNIKERAEAGSSNVEQTGRRFLPHQMPVKTTKTVTKKNIYTRMEKMEGPLAYLRKCKDERLQIKVWTRHAFDLRGFCIAHIVAFDKHWNLALENVTEVWTRPKTAKTPIFANSSKQRTFKKIIEPPKITVVATKKKFEICIRKLDQVLLRGENVAFLSVMGKYDVSEEIKKFVDSFK